MSKKIIGISIGDPAGIGPEILLKAFSFIQRTHAVVPLVISDYSVLKKNLKGLSQDIPLKSVKRRDEINKDILNFYDPGIIKQNDFPIGKDSKICGNASFIYVKEAVNLWKIKQIDALVTLPISKKAWHLAGHIYSGHTEMLAEELNVTRYAMMMVAGKFRVLLVTTHIPLKEIPLKLSPGLIVEKVVSGYEFILREGIKVPVIGVAALNPHAGEEGILGSEEEEIILPAVKILKEKGINCAGIFPADAIFRKALDGELDMIVAMYHDQALIPLKTFYFNRLVNCTTGLGLIRTSPGHGTGFDIAYKGKAEPSAFIAAYKMASKLIKRKYKGKAKVRMEFLTLRKSIELLRSREINIKKHLGQNFLIDKNGRDKTLSFGNFEKEDIVVEIGPGLGALTSGLIDKIRELYAFEIDPDFCEILKERFASQKNFHLLEKDFLQVTREWWELFPNKVKIISNTPYYISSPIAFRVLELREKVKLALLTVQKEVGERWVALPGSKNYGAISVLFSFYADAKICYHLRKDVFFPKPEVSSVVVKILPIERPEIDIADEKKFWNFLPIIFSFRRKKLPNVVKKRFHIEKKSFIDVLEREGISSDVRVEELYPREIYKIFKIINYCQR